MNTDRAKKTDACQWLKVAVDTVAGAPDWEENEICGTALKGKRHMQIRTPTGEIVDGGPDNKAIGEGNCGQRLGMKSVLAPVCKPLLSVGEVTSKGGAPLMLDDYLLAPRKKVGEEATVPRTPRLPPESASDIQEHDIDGHTVVRCRCVHCVGGMGRPHPHVNAGK